MSLSSSLNSSISAFSLCCTRVASQGSWDACTWQRNIFGTRTYQYEIAPIFAIHWDRYSYSLSCFDLARFLFFCRCSIIISNLIARWIIVSFSLTEVRHRSYANHASALCWDHCCRANIHTRWGRFSRSQCCFFLPQLTSILLLILCIFSRVTANVWTHVENKEQAICQLEIWQESRVGVAMTAIMSTTLIFYLPDTLILF